MLNLKNDDFKEWMREFEISKINGMRQDLPSVSRDIRSCNDDVFYRVVYTRAWDALKSLHTNRLNSLEEKTECYRSHYGSVNEIQNEIEGELKFVIRLLVEYVFWAGDNDGRIVPSFLHERENLLRLDKIVGEKHEIEEKTFSGIYDGSPMKIMRTFINSQGLKDAKSFVSEIVSENNKIIGLQRKTKVTKDEIVKIEEKLDEYKNQYNFILLSKAFSRMKSDKTDEYKIARRWMHAYTVLLMVIPIMILANLHFKWVDVGVSVEHLIYAIPLLTLEVFVFYFMRLYYGEVRSIRAQLLQIDLRLSLCEFVHDFIDKKNQTSGKDESWKNFESLIFSPIQMSADNIPSLLDGANAVAEVLGKVMPKK